MKFGPLAVDEVQGSILAHAVRFDAQVFKKGRVLSAADVKELKAAGFSEIIVAKLSAEDVLEDIAAHRVAIAACGSNAKSQEAFTGRANLYSGIAGLLRIDAVRVRAINHVHESLTLATLTDYTRVEAGQMIATIKVIPFAVPNKVLASALKLIGDVPVVEVVPFKSRHVGLIITKLPQTKVTLVAKSESSIRDRVVALGSELVEVRVCAHSQDAVQAEIRAMNADVILVIGASAIVDRADVIPAALVAAGGVVQHLGMPVDPGNLLMLGRFLETPIIGVPSCARSPKTNGFDWVLERILAGLEVSASDIMDLGAGGLLAEISSRPSPREWKTASQTAPRIAALVLAAGTSTRMGSNKLLADLHGMPMIAQTVRRIAGSSVESITVVIGHEAGEIKTALNDQDVKFVHNSNFTEGLATSLRAGVAALQSNCDAILVCLGDMPLIDPRDINRMIAAFNPVENRSIVVPVHERTFGNPVLWGAEHFAALLACEGDRGARGLLEKLKDDAVEIAIDNESVVLDADTPQALATIRSIANS
jgi:molybdenum cofactor cytidylyltransferase